MATLSDVRKFWEEHPLCALEIPHEPGSADFFMAHDSLKENSTDLFNMHLWEFNSHKDELVLDIGCGPGWLVQQYALGEAKVTGIDLTAQATLLTRKRLNYQSIKGNIAQADAERLPFKDGVFDFISCSGVLHHTPDIPSSVNEIYRVLKPGHKAIISLYYRSFIFHPLIFWLAKHIIRASFKKTGFRKQGMESETADNFIRLYDGDDNPVGKAFSKKEVARLFSGFSKVKYEIHYFPKRFFTFLSGINNILVLRMLDRFFGTLIFAIVTK